jgi:hypothetical protein
MGKTKPTGFTLGSLDEGDNPPSYEVIDREEILSMLGLPSKCETFEDLQEKAQKISTELFLNQAAIVLKYQIDYMERRRPLQHIEDFRILTILSDIMRKLNAYDVGIDLNRAWELLERHGYKIVDGSDSDKTV